MSSRDREQLPAALEELVGFLIVSARGLMDEPSDYGPMRLLDAAGRMVEALEAQGLTYYSGNEELLAKIKAGATGYDVVAPAEWNVSVMIKSGLLEPLDMDYLPNFQYVGEQFKVAYYDDPAQNDGLKYSVPYFYGSTGTAAAPTRSPRRRPTGRRSSTRSTRARSTCSTARARRSASGCSSLATRRTRRTRTSSTRRRS